MADDKNALRLTAKVVAELEAKLTRREELETLLEPYKPLKNELDKLNEDLKTRFEGRPVVELPNWIVTGEYSFRSGYVVKSGKSWKMLPARR